MRALLLVVLLAGPGRAYYDPKNHGRESSLRRRSDAEIFAVMKGGPGGPLTPAEQQHVLDLADQAKADPSKLPSDQRELVAWSVAQKIARATGNVKELHEWLAVLGRVNAPQPQRQQQPQPQGAQPQPRKEPAYGVVTPDNKIVTPDGEKPAPAGAQPGDIVAPQPDGSWAPDAEMSQAAHSDALGGAGGGGKGEPEVVGQKADDARSGGALVPKSAAGMAKSLDMAGKLAAEVGMPGGGGGKAPGTTKTGAAPQPQAFAAGRSGPAPDAGAAVAAARAPGQAALLSEVAAKYGAVPRAAQKSPDYFDPARGGIAPERYYQLATDFGERPDLRGTDFRHIALEGKADFKRSESCDKVSGGCNPHAQASYKKGEDVPARELDDIWKAVRGYLGGGGPAAQAASPAPKPAAAEAGSAPKPAASLWARLRRSLGLRKTGGRAKPVRSARTPAKPGEAPVEIVAEDEDEEPAQPRARRLGLLAAAGLAVGGGLLLTPWLSRRRA